MQTPEQQLAADTLDKPILPSRYFNRQCKKDLIVLHFTAGPTWQSAWHTFAAPGKMSVPYIVDVTGPKHVIRLYDDKFWAYHLGIKRDWLHANDKRSIGIEIVNIGPVWNRDGKWLDYMGKEHAASGIVAKSDRGADGSVKFPDEQVVAVASLVNHLIDKYHIPRQVPSEKLACQWPEIGKFKGVATHQMFRADKYDLGVAWPWEKFIKLCKLREL